MPAPTTTENLLDLVRRSGLVDAAQLEAHLQTAPLPSPTTPAALGATLVRAGLLTYFQAQQLSLGKWRGFQLGKYRLLELLGSGGMGRVFLGEHVRLHRLAAIKIPPLGSTRDAAAVERFYREARAVAALDHPNIVRAYDVDNDGKYHFLIMEFVDGSSLQKLMAGRPPLEVTRACHYIAQAAAGLRHAHAAGWIHRDIKPSNILLDRHGTVKLLDLGLARFFPEDRDGLTRKYDEGAIIGSADYLAPEQAVNSSTDLDTRADLYSLGATFYFLLTGQPPFADGNVTQKLIWHQLRTPRPIRKFRPEVPVELAAIINQMMAKDRAKRFQTPDEVEEALQPWTTQPIEVPPAKEMPTYCPLVWDLIQAASPRSPTGTPEPRHAPPLSAITSASGIRKIKSPSFSMKGSSRVRTLELESEGDEEEIVPTPPPARQRRWLVAVLAGVLVLGLGVGVTWLIFRVWPPGATTDPIRPGPHHQPVALAPGVITPAEALQHVSKKCTLQMTVRSTGWSMNRQMFFLNSEQNHREKDNFTVLSQQIEKFAVANIADPATYFEGKTIRVVGTVTLYQGRPQIVVTDPGQIEVVERKAKD